MILRTLSINAEIWPLKVPFVIARSSRTQSHLIKVDIIESELTGSGECCPTFHYGETMTSVLQQLECVKADIESGLTRDELQSLMPAGAARNAVDCALWDLEAKQQKCTVMHLLNYPNPDNIQTVQTISIASAEEMGKCAKSFASCAILKVKLNRDDILNRLTSIHNHAPKAKILIDANESWTIDLLKEISSQLKDLPVIMIEQPLPAGQDNQLKGLNSLIPIGADESCHTAKDVDRLKSIYDVINIKLDKCGGLTEGIKIVEAAHQANMDIMIGCMLGTSLSMAPAMILATQAKYVDLDGPTMLKSDRSDALSFNDGQISPLKAELWGG